MHLAVTDSGVGGLSACAAIERAIRSSWGPPRENTDTPPRDHTARLTYVNVWPSEHGGYNDMPTIEARAAVFDDALAAIAALGPDRIVIACNTLSIVYEHTGHRVRTARASTPASRVAPSGANLPPVLGIVDAGVDLFSEALAAEPRSAIALFGTRTTIESGVHRDRLVGKGVPAARIVTVGCHGLAKSIETEMDGPLTRALVDECMGRAAQAVRTAAGGALFLGICCTHYTYVREDMRRALERHTGRVVEVLDPTDRLVAEVLARENLPAPASGSRGSAPSVTVISKVRMPDEKRRVIAERLGEVSPATAQALERYVHVPTLF